MLRGVAALSRTDEKKNETRQEAKIKAASWRGIGWLQALARRGSGLLLLAGCLFSLASELRSQAPPWWAVSAGFFCSHSAMVFCQNGHFARYLKDEHLSDSRLRFSASPAWPGPESSRDPFGSGKKGGEALRLAEMPEVRRWLRYYTGRGRETMRRWLVRGESYKDVLVPLLRREGLPGELFFLAMIESGFLWEACSRARAAGLWQFLPATAGLYGLRSDLWIDERRDPVKSTLAAAGYLKKLYRVYDDWFLAMAAYNAGPGRIDRSMRKSGCQNYWCLLRRGYLSRETGSYVPKVLAALTIGKNPRAYGHVPDVPEKKPGSVFPVHGVLLSKPVSLRELSRFLGIEYGLISFWNPELLRGMTPPPGSHGPGSYALRLPETYIHRYEMIEASLTEAGWQEGA